MMPRRTAILALLSIGLAASVFAQRSLPKPQDVADLGAHVATSTTTTYEDLLRLVFPTMHEDAGETVYGPTAVPVRALGSDAAPAVLEHASKLESLSALWLADGAATHLLLLIEVEAEDANADTPFEGEADLLAAFDVAPAPRLLDVVDVKTDRFTGFSSQHPVVALGPEAQGCVVYSEHDNSSQSYEHGTVLHVHRGRLMVAADVFLLSWRECAGEILERATFRTTPRSGSRFADLVLTVTVETRPGAEGCGTRRFARSTRRYVETLRWRGDRRGYTAAGGTLDRLDRFNQRNY